ncbi:MAG TPA: hypothetical protein P5280_01275 [Cyclobacteriaceae bacterium]|nr:hypothetical protein [Cyclobacteriaceae bacterium]
MKRLFISIILGLLILLVTLGTVQLSATSVLSSFSEFSTLSSPFDDDFNSSTLDPKWHWVRETPTHWSLTAAPGFLRIITQRKDIWQSNNSAPLLLQSLQSSSGDDLEIQTRIVITPTANHHQGGLVFYSNDNNYVRLTYGYMGSLRFEFAKEIEGNFQPIQVPAPSDINDFYLRIVKLDTSYYGYYSQDGINWTFIGLHNNVNISPSEFGLLAFNSEDETSLEIPADFDYFRVTVPCEVPFFWQRDPAGINDHPLRGTCGTGYDTLGEGGCTLTSATMLFRHYGADTTINNTEMTPPNLSDCMNTSACPFNWVSGADCSNGKASNPRRDKSFSYQRLDQELNQNHRPIILQMCRPKGACNWEGPITHWVLVVGGQGANPVDYTIWDPWFECGQNMRLNSRSETWDFVGMAVYDGTPTCGFSTEVPSCARSISPVPLPSVANATIAEQNMATPPGLTASSNISGTAVLYRTTNITMTVHLTAQSSAGNVTDMLIWSDTISNTTWQPFSPYVWLPLSDFVYAQFRDDKGNISAVVSDTPNPSAPPVAPDPDRVYLPLATR